MGRSDDVVLIPLTTAMDRLLAITYVHMVYVQVTRQEEMVRPKNASKRCFVSVTT